MIIDFNVIILCFLFYSLVEEESGKPTWRPELSPTAHTKIMKWMTEVLWPAKRSKSSLSHFIYTTLCVCNFRRCSSLFTNKASRWFDTHLVDGPNAGWNLLFSIVQEIIFTSVIAEPSRSDTSVFVTGFPSWNMIQRGAVLHLQSSAKPDTNTNSLTGTTNSNMFSTKPPKKTIIPFPALYLDIYITCTLLRAHYPA